MHLTFHDYRAAVAALPFGKRLPGATYVWRYSLKSTSPVLHEVVEAAATTLDLDNRFNLVKFHTGGFKLSLLSYPDFWTDPHPRLHESVAVDLGSGRARRQRFIDRLNPPILHRKETFLPPDHPQADEFAALTAAEEQAGLYREPHRIGFADNWSKILAAKGLAYSGHQLVSTKEPDPSGVVADSLTGKKPQKHPQVAAHLLPIHIWRHMAPAQAHVAVGLVFRHPHRPKDVAGCG